MNWIKKNSLALLCILFCQPISLLGQCEYIRVDSLNLTKVFLKYEIEDYLDFKNSTAQFDVCVLSTKGGIGEFSYLRITYVDSLTIQITKQDLNQDTTYLSNTSLDLKHLSPVGIFYAICPYNTSNNAFMLCLKSNGQIYLKTHSVGTGYRKIPFEGYQALLEEVLRVGNKDL